MLKEGFKWLLYKSITDRWKTMFPIMIPPSEFNNPQTHLAYPPITITMPTYPTYPDIHCST